MSTADFGVGSLCVIDGKVHTITECDGVTARGTRANGNVTSFDAREVVTITDGLWGLQGRVERPVAPPATAIVTDAAEAHAIGR